MKGIRHLAKQLNISIGTVSKALNGRHDVNEKTRKRVLAAAAKLGYAPNQSGRSLRQGSTNAVGFLIEFSPEAAANSDNFFVGLVKFFPIGIIKSIVHKIIIGNSARGYITAAANDNSEKVLVDF